MRLAERVREIVAAREQQIHTIDALFGVRALGPSLGLLAGSIPVPLAPMTVDGLIGLVNEIEAVYPGRLAWRMSKATRRRVNERLRRAALPSAKRRAIRASVRHIARSRRWWSGSARGRWA